MIINFDQIEQRIDELRDSFLNAKPFAHVAIDNFIDNDIAVKLYESIPSPADGNINKSRDYIFAKNKFEKSNFREISPDFNQLYEELTSERMEKILQKITGEESLFVDKDFHGGGIHQGGKNSFLDMHADFNYHPLNNDWFRNINILLYMNKDWKNEHKGQLKLRHKDTNEYKEVEPLFNRCVLMRTRDYTLHGYDPINFPEGKYRRSVATYAYTIDKSANKKIRSTDWVPENASPLKRAINVPWPYLLKIKHALLGSGTAKNK